jgi:pimeloyl-ACP methyl ester carboxylesterase
MHALLDRLRRHPPGLVAGVGLLLVLLVLGVVVAIRGGGDDAAPDSPGARNGPCIVRLHGKGGSGEPTTITGAVAVVSPRGNGTGWNGRQWSYATDADYTAARTVVATAIAANGCTSVVLNGFSNGAAFAAKLYCRGETFDGHVVGVVVDDPVTDHAVDGCAPATGVKAALYWTGALEGGPHRGPATPGWSCAEADWTCEGGSTIGIVAYAATLHLTVMPSPNTEHAAFGAVPEPARWLAG